MPGLAFESLLLTLGCLALPYYKGRCLVLLQLDRMSVEVNGRDREERNGRRRERGNFNQDVK